MWYNAAMNKAILWIAGIIGVLFLILAFIYWTTPAGALPPYLPGYVPGEAHIHFKHGLGAIIVAVALFIFVWFKTGPKQGAQAQ